MYYSVYTIPGGSCLKLNAIDFVDHHLILAFLSFRLGQVFTHTHIIYTILIFNSTIHIHKLTKKTSTVPQVYNAITCIQIVFCLSTDLNTGTFVHAL